MQIEIVAAGEKRQLLREFDLPAGTTAREAVVGAGFETLIADIDFQRAPIGIWGRVVDDAQVLESGDRVEVYRPLQIDPREARRRRAAEGRTMREPRKKSRGPDSAPGPDESR